MRFYLRYYIAVALVAHTTLTTDSIAVGLLMLATAASLVWRAVRLL